MFETGRYAWCLFLSHIVIEKTLKAFWARDSKKRVPRIHNLLQLLEGTKLNLSKEQKKFLADIIPFNIKARYPDYKLTFYKRCTREFTELWFAKIKGFHLWLLSQIESEQSSSS